MDAKVVEVFLKATSLFFSDKTHSSCELGEVALQPDLEIAADCTVIVGIGGYYRICLGLCLSQSTVKLLSKEEFADSGGASSEEDWLGSIARFIAERARNDFDFDYTVSVPLLICGPPKIMGFSLEVSKFVVPIRWKDETAHLLIAAEEPKVYLGQIIKFIHSHCKTEQEANLAVYQVFMNVPQSLLEREGIQSPASAREHIPLENQELQLAISKATEKVIGVAFTWKL
ncbi:MAG: hypothetical protein AAF558_14565 [Verrucomicrobiota bacterium]